jgi:hypothetical protein
MQRIEKGKPSKKRKKEEEKLDKNRSDRKVNMTKMIEENSRYSSKPVENIDDKRECTWKYWKKIQLKGGGKEENEKERRKHCPKGG